VTEAVASKEEFLRLRQQQAIEISRLVSWFSASREGRFGTEGSKGSKGEQKGAKNGGYGVSFFRIC